MLHRQEACYADVLTLLALACLHMAVLAIRSSRLSGVCADRTHKAAATY